jgi:tripartite-type tricarboxylate transporter receptor subunit TctC
MIREWKLPSWRILVGALIFSVILLTLWGGDKAAAWQPKKPIEFIVMAGQGGGADLLARLVQTIVQKHNLAPQPLVVINKPGGAGAEALEYLRSKQGDPHVILITLNSFFTTPLRTKLPVSWKDLTPISRLAMDTFVLWVNSESSYKTAEEYIQSVKDKPVEFKMGGTGTGQEDSLVTAMLEEAYGLKFTYVPFAGGGTVASNLIGKHVDSTVNNPSEQMGYFKAGRSRPLAAFTPERLPQFPDVPTFKELGKDLVYYMQRSIVAPGKIPADVEAFYVGLFQKITESSEWQEYVKNEGLEAAFLTGEALRQFFAEQEEIHRRLLKAMGEM